MSVLSEGVVSFDEYYLGIPEHIRAGMGRYVRHGVQPGSFLTAVVCNNLAGALAHGDRSCTANLRLIVDWFYNEVPASCWGTPEKMKAWMKQGGLDWQQAC